MKSSVTLSQSQILNRDFQYIHKTVTKNFDNSHQRSTTEVYELPLNKVTHIDKSLLNSTQIILVA